MINDNSRYARDSVIQRVAVVGKSPERAVYQDPPVYDEQAYLVVLSQEGDTFESLAYTSYRDPEQWWLIARANPHVFFPGTIAPGTMLRVPQ